MFIVKARRNQRVDAPSSELFTTTHPNVVRTLQIHSTIVTIFITVLVTNYSSKGKPCSITTRNRVICKVTKSAVTVRRPATSSGPILYTTWCV